MSWTRLCGMLGVAMLWLLQSGCPGAHEIGTTQVHFELRGGTNWIAVISMAPTALVNRLEAEAGEPLSRDLTAERVRSKLLRFGPALARHVEVRFDGVAAPADISVSVVEMPTDLTLPAFVVLRAEGAVPPDARTMSWRYDLVTSTYAVVFTDEARGSPQTQWVEADAPSRPFPIAAAASPPSTAETVWEYLRLGFEHIVPEGLDHILFVLGLFLPTTTWRPVLTQVTAFTVAHSVTLGLTMFGVISLSPRIVEPLIALSIVYVAFENVATPRLTPWRPAVVFCFGLLHGMGFAKALTDLQIPPDEALQALVSFNVGIELAQLFVIGVAFVIIVMWFRNKPWYRSRIVVPASVAIAGIGLLWAFERVTGS